MTGSRRLSLAVFGIALLAGGLGAVPAAATFPGPNGKIAFVRGGNIWVMNPNGSGQVRLTGIGTAANPQWSADGTKIAYDRHSVSAGRNIWVMNGDGSGKYRVTFHAANEFDPAWSPNGKWLAFVSDRRARGEIFKLRSTAPFGTAIRLTTTAGSGTPEPTWEDPYLSDMQPNWSPSGARISFSRYIRSDDTSAFSYGIELTTMNPDGSALSQHHVPNGLGETCSNWSPGRRRILWVDDEFEFLQALASNTVWHSNPDGSDPRKVTHFDQDPDGYWDVQCASWAPNGKGSIVFSAFQDAGDGSSVPTIYRVAANGLSSPTALASAGSDPDWGRVPAST
jgi:Tol biopolymer transport system component